MVAGNRFQSIESTAEIAGTNDALVNVPPRTSGDTDYTAGAPSVPIGRAGNQSGGFNPNTNGGGHGRIVVYWVVLTAHWPSPKPTARAAISRVRR